MHESVAVCTVARARAPECSTLYTHTDGDQNWHQMLDALVLVRRSRTDVWCPCDYSFLPCQHRSTARGVGVWLPRSCGAERATAEGGQTIWLCAETATVMQGEAAGLHLGRDSSGARRGCGSALAARRSVPFSMRMHGSTSRKRTVLRSLSVGVRTMDEGNCWPSSKLAFAPSLESGEVGAEAGSDGGPSSLPIEPSRKAA